MQVRLSKTFGFEAAHWLPCFPPEHKCRRMHGHSFRVEVVVEGPLARRWMAIAQAFAGAPTTARRA